MFGRRKALAKTLPIILAFASPNPASFDDGQKEVRPVGNAFPTFTRMSVEFTADNPNARQFIGVFGLLDGGGGRPQIAMRSVRSLGTPNDKVALYAGAKCKAGGAPCWTYNSSLVIDPGFASGGGHGATGSEIDVNDNDVDTGDGDGANGATADPGYYALAITGVGSKRVTSAVSVGGPGDRTIFNRGFVVLNNAVRQCSLCDYGISSIALDIRGTHETAFDASKARVAAAIKLANGQNIASLRSDGGGVQLLNIGGDNFVNLAPLGANGTRLGERGKPIIFNGPAGGQLHTPSNSHEPCFAGQFADDRSFHYVCVGPNRWKRVALSDF